MNFFTFKLCSVVYYLLLNKSDGNIRAFSFAVMFKHNYQD